MVDGKLGCWTEASGEEETVQDEQRNNSSAVVDKRAVVLKRSHVRC